MAIQQHPIPQNVTQYQFRLVGDMTLKQFLQLAGGIVVAVVIYALPLPVFFKWPLIAIAAGAGAGMAFLPVEGRPMDQWIVAFVRSIYQPTIYTWQKSVPHLDTKNPEPTRHNTPVLDGITQGKQTLVPPTPPIKTDIPSPTGENILTPANTQPITRSPQTIYTSPPQELKIDKQIPLASPEPKAEAGQNQPISVPMTMNDNLKPITSPLSPVKALLPIPHPPQTGNTIVGMTLTPAGSILDSAIVEIIQNKATVRATKSNKLGQFLFAKPLDDGDYQITAERQGYTFPTYSLNLTGQIIQPIELKATSEATG